MRRPVIFLIGDEVSGTGPANVTLSLRKALAGHVLYLKSSGKAARGAEILIKMRKADAAVFSGHSRQNLLGMNWAAFLKIPSVYIMHGCVEYEGRLNRVPDPGMARDERAMMDKADLILAVSRQFEDWLKAHYPEHRGKISHLINGVDWERFREEDSSLRRPPCSVLSVGGGMPRKNIRTLCRAVELLRKEGMEDIFLTVAGDEGADSEEIRSWPFVRDAGLVGKEEMDRLYRTHRLFVQNSVFETFGLAPVEALLSGADLLISDRCGVLSIFQGTEEGDLIRNPGNPREIADKMAALLKNGNHGRLIRGMDKESTTWEKRSEELTEICGELIRKKGGKGGRS